MHSGLKTALLLGGLTGLLMFIGGVTGGQTGLVFAFVIAALMSPTRLW